MSNLVLIPTAAECRVLRPRLRGLSSQRSGDWSVALCGFGLVAAAARTAMLIADQRPRRVVLVGIAGALSEQTAVGSASTYRRVTCHGIGVGGESDDYLSVVQMGWSHWPGSADRAAIGDTIELAPACDSDEGLAASNAGATLLSVCAASADRRQAEQRRQRYPEAGAEEMEGFGVALACSLADVPLWIVRGISNVAGDRDLGRWQIEAALSAAAERTNRLIEQMNEET